MSASPMVTKVPIAGCRREDDGEQEGQRGREQVHGDHYARQTDPVSGST
jgi:hypothetical protein